jgi:hypothetical protein
MEKRHAWHYNTYVPASEPARLFISRLPETPMIKKHLLAWIPMVFLAILNGVIRDTTYGQALSHELAHQVSTITLILIFTVYIWFLSRKWPLHSLVQATAIGAAWLMLTVAFEFAMGRYMNGLSWVELFRAYDLLSGNLWIMVPLSLGVLPAVFFLLTRYSKCPG